MKKLSESSSFKRNVDSFLDGMRQAFVLFPEQDYIIPSRKDFYRDASALRGDAFVVARELRKETAKHVKNNSD